MERIGVINCHGGRQVLYQNARYYYALPEKHAEDRSQHVDACARYRITRMVSRTILRQGVGAAIICGHDCADIVAMLRTELGRDHITDPGFVALAKLCEGADSSDIDKFALAHAIGHEADTSVDGVRMLVSHTRGGGAQKWLQSVTTHTDGYGVEHTELTPKVARALACPEVAAFAAAREGDDLLIDGSS